MNQKLQRTSPLKFPASNVNFACIGVRASLQLQIRIAKIGKLLLWGSETPGRWRDGRYSFSDSWGRGFPWHGFFDSTADGVWPNQKTYDCWCSRMLKRTYLKLEIHTHLYYFNSGEKSPTSPNRCRDQRGVTPASEAYRFWDSTADLDESKNRHLPSHSLKPKIYWYPKTKRFK